MNDDDSEIIAEFFLPSSFIPSRTIIVLHFVKFLLNKHGIHRHG